MLQRKLVTQLIWTCSLLLTLSSKTEGLPQADNGPLVDSGQIDTLENVEEETTTKPEFSDDSRKYDLYRRAKVFNSSGEIDDNSLKEDASLLGHSARRRDTSFDFADLNSDDEHSGLYLQAEQEYQNLFGGQTTGGQGNSKPLVARSATANQSTSATELSPNSTTQPLSKKPHQRSLQLSTAYEPPTQESHPISQTINPALTDYAGQQTANVQLQYLSNFLSGLQNQFQTGQQLPSPNYAQYLQLQQTPSQPASGLIGYNSNAYLLPYYSQLLSGGGGTSDSGTLSFGNSETAAYSTVNQPEGFIRLIRPLIHIIRITRNYPREQWASLIQQLNEGNTGSVAINTLFSEVSSEEQRQNRIIRLLNMYRKMAHEYHHHCHQ